MLIAYPWSPLQADERLMPSTLENEREGERAERTEVGAKKEEETSFIARSSGWRGVRSPEGGKKAI